MKAIPTAQSKLKNLQQQLKIAQENVSIPFSKENELQETLKRLKVVNAELKIGENNSSEVIDIDDEEDIEVGEYKKQKEYVR